MSFVSYAKNFTDVMLWSAIKHVQDGVYFDVSAQHLVVGSVSKALYECDWNSIHFESVRKYAELLCKGRPNKEMREIVEDHIDRIASSSVRKTNRRFASWATCARLANSEIVGVS